MIGVESQVAASAPVELWSTVLVHRAVDLGGVVIVLCMLVCVWRLLRGPHLADRALAVDNFAICLIAGVILLTLRMGTLVYVDGILVLSLLGFTGTVAMALYIARNARRKARTEVKRGKDPT